MRTFVTVAITISLSANLAVATPLVAQCDLKSAIARVNHAADAKEPDWLTMNDALRRLEGEAKQCLNDKDHDGRVDMAESGDAVADSALRKARDDRKRIAASAGWPFQSLDFKLTPTLLKGGTGTTDEARRWVRAIGCADDDAGHIRGNALGGNGGKTSKNIFPQSPRVNRGAFAKYEGKVREWTKLCHADKGPALEVKVSFTFGDTVRPERPTYVHYTIKGGDPQDNCRQTTMSESFANPRPSTCVE